jgi:hypothetical protein
MRRAADTHDRILRPNLRGQQRAWYRRLQPRSAVGAASSDHRRDGPNGCKKILIVNGRGGNVSLLPYFAQSQLDKPHDYVVYLFDQRTPATSGPKRKTSNDQHAGESETSEMIQRGIMMS